MKLRFFFPLGCILFVFSGLMTSCGEQPSMHEHVVTPSKPAGEKPAAAPEKPPAEKSAAKPEASAVVTANKEPAAAPEQPSAEKPAAKPEASTVVSENKEPAAAPEKPSGEKSITTPEASEAVAAKGDPVVPFEKKSSYDRVAKSYAERVKAVAKQSVPKRQAADMPVVEVTIKQGTAFEYGTDMGGPEQEARIKHPGKHYQDSYIKRDATTSFEAVYIYRPKPDYVGKDFSQLVYSEHQRGSGPDDPGKTTETLQVINITVVEKLPREEEKSAVKLAPAKPDAGKTVFKYPVIIKATVKNSEEYEYRTGFGGDEQGASIRVQADHFEKSEIIRNPSTGFEPVYKYKPKGDYVGKDSIELELVDHELGSGPDDPGKTTKTRVVINFTVVK